MNKKLTNCKTCGNEVAKSAKKCPHCGAKRNPNQPAGIILGTLVLIVVFAYMFSAINAGDSASKVSTTPNATSPANGEPQAKTSPEPTPEPDYLGDWEITSVSCEIQSSVSSGTFTAFKPDDGNVFIVVSLTVKNLGTEAKTFLPILSLGNDVTAKITYQDKYEYSATTLLGHSADLHYETLNPLTTFSGIIAFQVSEEVSQSDDMYFILSLGKESLSYKIA